MGHRSIATTQGYYSVTATRDAQERWIPLAGRASSTDAGTTCGARHGVLLDKRTPNASLSVRSRSRSASAPSPSNVQASGGACPFRFRCLGCGHFRSDPSYLPELRDYLDTLLRDRERDPGRNRTRRLGAGRSDALGAAEITPAAER